jgi:hypothetical protein
VGEIRLGTIGDVVGVHAIYAHCSPCRRSMQLDLARLIAVYGAGLAITALRQRVTCSRCGQRRHEIRLVFSLPAR